MGFFKNGEWYLLGIQSLSALCLTLWGFCSTYALLYAINIFIPIRMDPNEELVGADLMEHRIKHSKIGISRAISALAPLKVDLHEVSDVPPIGMNPRHEQVIDELQEANNKMKRWNDFYDRMSAKNIKTPKETFDQLTNYKLTHRKRVFTLNPGKLRKNSKIPKIQQNEIDHSNNRNEMNMRGRYINQNDENTLQSANNVSAQRSDSHFAWVD